MVLLKYTDFLEACSVIFPDESSYFGQIPYSILMRRRYLGGNTAVNFSREISFVLPTRSDVRTCSQRV